MEYTSAEANKLLKKLYEQERSLVMLEERSKEFRASIGEDVEMIRPAYNYEEVQIELQAIRMKILKVKHAVNLFNVHTMVPGFDLTIDQVLVYMGQLSSHVEKLAQMKERLPMERIGATALGGRSAMPMIEYDYANYDIQKVAQDYATKSDELARLQMALDLLNNTQTFEIEL